MVEGLRASYSDVATFEFQYDAGYSASLRVTPAAPGAAGFVVNTIAIEFVVGITGERFRSWEIVNNPGGRLALENVIADVVEGRMRICRRLFTSRVCYAAYR